MTATFEAGAFVVVVTINDGIPVVRKAIETRWPGRIIGPSPIGAGWWLVRKLGRDGELGKAGGVYTVPESEIWEPPT